MRATSCIARAQPANVFHGPFSRGHSERAESGYGGRRPLADEAASENMDYRKQLRLAIGFDDCVDSAGALRQGQDARFTNGLCDLIPLPYRVESTSFTVTGCQAFGSRCDSL
jgi:hypothetical protein